MKYPYTPHDNVYMEMLRNILLVIFAPLIILLNLLFTGFMYVHEKIDPDFYKNNYDK